MSMGLHFILFLAALDIVNDQLALVVNSGDITDGDWRGFEGRGLQTELFLPLAEQLKLAAIELIDVENALGRRALTEEAESCTLWDPIDFKWRESDAL